MFKTKVKPFTFEVNMVRRDVHGKPLMNRGQMTRKVLRSNSGAKIAYDFYKNGGR